MQGQRRPKSQTLNPQSSTLNPHSNPRTSAGSDKERAPLPTSERGSGRSNGSGVFAHPEAGAVDLMVHVFFTLVTGPRRSLSLKLSDTGASNTSPPRDKRSQAAAGGRTAVCLLTPRRAASTAWCTPVIYRGTSLIRKRPPRRTQQYPYA